MEHIVYDLLYYIYAFLFGIYVSIKIARGNFSAREWRTYLIVCPALLLLQGIGLAVWDMESVRLLYPLIVHLPTVLALRFALRVRWGAGVVSVVLSYSMCQLLRWIGLVLDAFPMPLTAAIVIHLALSQLLLVLLDRYCLGAIHQLMNKSDRVLRQFGALPALYYAYDYFMIYTNQRYAHIMAFHELIPTEMVLFFILFAIGYHREMEKRAQAEQQAAALEMKLARAGRDAEVLRAVQEQTAIHRHDLHHHLRMIGGLLSSGKPEQAEEYIRKVEGEIDAIVPARFCENDMVNLLLCFWQERAKESSVVFSAKASIPDRIGMPDTELCAMLSNGLENAFNAASPLDNGYIDVYCGIRQNHLLFEIKNPYAGEVLMEDGLPQAKTREKRYGCRSIQSIVTRRKGVCTFEAANGVFVLRIALPMNADGMK